MNRSALLLLLVFTAACAHTPAARSAQPTSGARADLAITHINVIDVTDGSIRSDQTVLISGNRINAVGRHSVVSVPQEARVVDARGKYLIPGLADMHVHFGTGGLEPRDSLTTERVLRQFLFYGVTTVLNVGATGGSADEILDLRRRHANGEILAPHIYATGGLLTLPGGHPIARWSVPQGADPATYDWSQRGVWVVRTPAEMSEVVSRMAAAGMDGIKVVIESGPSGDDYPRMPLEMVEAAVEAARRHGLPVFAHATSPDELEDATAAGVRAIMHAVGNPFPGPEHWAEMQERDVFLVPTMSLFAPMVSDRWSHPDSLDDPFLRAGVASHTLESMQGWRSPMASMPTDTRADLFRSGLASIAAAHRAGVPIALGTDTNNPFVFPGYSAHVELELLVEAGLTPMEALIAATRRAAEMLGKGDEFGTIAPGQRADLVLLDANPLEDIRNTQRIAGVVLNGRYLDRQALDALLARAEAEVSRR